MLHTRRISPKIIIIIRFMDLNNLFVIVLYARQKRKIVTIIRHTRIRSGYDVITCKRV